MQQKIVIALAGLGTVGQGVVKLLQENYQEIKLRSQKEIIIKHIVVRDKNKIRNIDLPNTASISDNIDTIINDPEVNLVIELMGGLTSAYDLIKASLKQGKAVITANKALLAEKGEELFTLANQNKAPLLFEASVNGAIPVIKVFKDSLAANKINSFSGILNGTSNYILSEMTSNNLDFATALAEAQKLGFAEAEPSLDIDGYDAAHKLTILILLAWGETYPFNKLYVQGIRGLERMDIEYAREFGYRIKLIGEARRIDNKIEAGVFPCLIHYKYLLAKVGGAYNALRIEADAAGPLFLHGLGAGAMPTASSVVADLIDFARENNLHSTGFFNKDLAEAKILATNEANFTWYLRLMVKDSPGVLRDIAGALANEGVSVAQAIQKGQDKNSQAVPAIFMTYEATQIAIEKAIHSMQKMDFLLAKPVYYRVQGE